MVKLTEYDLVKIVKSKIVGYTIMEEISFFRRSIDMVLIDEDNGILKTIEFKLNNWKKALMQIRDHQVVADYSYLCMPKKENIHPELKAHLEKEGIGLLLFDLEHKRLETVSEARISPRHCGFFKAKLINRLGSQ
ncbi:MAG: hypothetical protein AB7E49_09965 [Campylobacterales bacterium]